MFKLLKFVLLCCFSFALQANAWASEHAYGKQYATDWINKSVKGSNSQTIKTIVDIAFEQGIKHKIDPFLILAVIKKESAFKPIARNRSKASGLMQVIPYWHRDKIRGRNIFSVPVNIEVGTLVLKDCLDRNYQNLNKALRCYSGGAGIKYAKDIRSTRTTLTKWVIENQFENHVPIYYAVGQTAEPSF